MAGKRRRQRPLRSDSGLSKFGWGCYGFVVVLGVLMLPANGIIGVVLGTYADLSRHWHLGAAGPYLFASIELICALLTVGLARLPKDKRYVALFAVQAGFGLDSAFSTRSANLIASGSEGVLWIRLGVSMLVFAFCVALWVIGRRTKPSEAGNEA